MANHIGLIVDGEGDFASFRRKFKDGFRILKTDGPRGHTVTPEQIVNRSRKQVLMLQAFRCDAVIIVLDFEERSMRYGEFCKALEDRVKSLKFPVPVQVAVPNQMIENWYLADIHHLSMHKRFLKEDLQQKPYEGKAGKKIIKRMMRKGYSYSETKHGPELFEAIRLGTARRNSSSFDAFLSHIEDAIEGKVSNN